MASAENNHQQKKIFWGSILLNVVLLLVLFASFRIYNASAKKASTEYFQKYQERRKGHFKVLANLNQEIIFAGDEWIENMPWAELFANPHIINRGIQRDNTQGLLERIAEITESEPDKVFILIGSQDLAQGKEQNEIIQNYKQIITEIAVKSPKTQIFVHSILPVNERTGKRNNQNIQELNKKIAALAAEYKITFIDLYEAFAIKGFFNEEFTNNGIHLNGKGYQQWKNLIGKYIQLPKTTDLLKFGKDADKKIDSTRLSPKKPEPIKIDTSRTLKISPKNTTEL